MLQLPSGSIGGLWATGKYVEQCSNLDVALKACIADAKRNSIRFFSLRLEENALAALHTAEEVGFRVIESFLTFRRPTTEEIPLGVDSALEPATTFYVRRARPADMETVADLAFRTFQFFRLFADPCIPEERARHSRQEWVRNGFKGRADAMYVAESGNYLAGFALLQLKIGANGEKIGVIELIAVAAEFSGRGIGKALVAQFIRHYQGKASEIEVGTQDKNTRAVGLYIRMGFRLVRSEFSLHRYTDSSTRG